MRRTIFTSIILLAGLSFACNDSGFISGDAKKKDKSARNAGDSDGDKNDPADGGAGGAGGDDGFPSGSEAAETAKKLPKFGMLVNDLQCGLCHVKVRGDVASTRTVDFIDVGSKAHVLGSWFAAADFNAMDNPAAQAGTTTEISITATGGIKEHYTGPEVPKSFPSLNSTLIREKVRGSVTLGGSKVIDKIKEGNIVLTGTTTKPIVIQNDVLITGDLVISGSYKGNGTIYVSGNVYIPANLRAMKSPFPYPDDREAAMKRANDIAKDLSYDGLGIVTKRSIFLGDIEKKEDGENGPNSASVYTHHRTPADRTATALGTLGVYNWFSGGKAGFDSLYGKAYDCRTASSSRLGSIDLVDAFLMAENTVAGVSRRASYAIRGGVIADHFHIITGAQRCNDSNITAASPVHGQAMNWSYVEYDYRLATGKYLIMERVADAIGHD